MKCFGLAKYSWGHYGFIKSVSRVYQGCTMDVQNNVAMLCFSKELHGCFKNIPRVFHEGIVVVKRLIQDCFKAVSRVSPRIFVSE